jgi:spore maturation protein CgeB
VFIDKGIYVWPLTVRNIKRMAAAAVVHYLPDDYYGSGLHLRLVTRAICDYDAVFTTKTYNVRELERAGVTRVQYVPNAYDPLLHRPPELTEAERRIYGCDISFIGRWEPDRQETLTHLAEKGYKMKIWGDGWNKAGIPDRLRPCVQGRGVFGAEYAKAIAASSINLNILSKWYRDEETQRSIEIPACAGFMLAERTARHLEYFEEGKEAEFYSCEGELSEKCSYYIEHPADAQSIGAAGRQRCIRSDYSYADRINSIFDYLAEEHLL